MVIKHDTTLFITSQERSSGNPIKLKLDNMFESGIKRFGLMSEYHLKAIVIDQSLCKCRDSACTDTKHIEAIDELYANIIPALIK